MSTKLKCLLLDDELPGLAYLRTICAQIPDVEVVKAFSDPARFITEAPLLNFDFYISDINMPGLNGIELARMFSEKPVIFTTAYKEFGADAFELDAADYIVKPIRRERFEKAIRKVRHLLYSKSTPPVSEPLVLNSSKGKLRIEIATIAVIRNSEIDRRDKTVVFQSGEELLLKNISFHQLEQLLPPHKFCRINKKEIVSVQAIKYYTHEKVGIVTNTRELNLFLSPAYKTQLISLLEK